jgi:tetratricopeptide (TPR) repeat protein
MRPVRGAVVAFIVLCGCAGAASASNEDEPPTLTLRARDVSVRTVLYALFQVTRQGYVIDADVVDRVDVELKDVTAADLHAELERLGVSVSPPGRIRRVSASAEPFLPPLRGGGHPISLDLVRPGMMRDCLRLMADITGWEIVAPRDPLGTCSLVHDDVPLEDVFAALLASAGMDHRRDGARVQVFRKSDPGALLLPLDVGGRHVGHLASREGEGPQTRTAGMAGFLFSETRFEGLFADGETWAALLSYPEVGRPIVARAGQRFYDGVLESVGPDGIVARLDTGERVERRWAAGPPGVTVRDDARTVVERAAAHVGRSEFDAAEGILKAGAQRFTSAADAPRVRAGLGDLHYQWGLDLFARGALPDAARHFEEAYEADIAERPGQAAEDLNELGFAWAELGEPERAVGPHQKALELARSEAVRKEPRPFTCVRLHPRSPFLEGAALNGLAHAERLRGRLDEARRLYEQAIESWRKVGDDYGASAALTGLGLVEHARGRLRQAIGLHRKALEGTARDGAARAAILNNLGRAQAASGRHEEAAASLRESLGLYRELRVRTGEGTVLNNLGALWEAKGDVPRACAAYAEAMTASREADDRTGTAITAGHLRRLLAAGRPDDPAPARCAEALAAAP